MPGVHGHLGREGLAGAIGEHVFLARGVGQVAPRVHAPLVVRLKKNDNKSEIKSERKGEDEDTRR